MQIGEMRRYKLAAFGQPLCEAVEAVAEPSGTEILLRVAACGICHSDLHLMDGHFDLGGGQKLDLARSMKLPHVLGHEIVGEVVALGPEAVGVALGDRRLAFPWIGCGACALCRAGAEHLCARPRALGVSVDGGFGTHVLVPHPRYLVGTGDLPEELACTYACSGLTAYSALKKCGTLGPGDAALIIGAGGVGLAAVNLAPLTWGIRPIVADVDPAKRAAAIEAGVAQAVDPKDPDARKRLVRETDGGVAAVIDFVGLESTAEFGLSVLRKGGRHVSVGLFGGSVTLPLPTLAMRGITLTGSYVGSLTELRELVALLREHGPYPLPVSRRPLRELTSALEDLRAGRVVGRAVVTP